MDDHLTDDPDDLAQIRASWDLTDPAPPRGPAPWTGPLARRLLRLGGLDAADLDPVDRYYYATQVLLIVGVGAMATISLTVALTMTLGVSAVGVPLVAGLFFGAFVVVNDLGITMPDPHRRQSWASTAGRLAFSVTFGVLAAFPLTAVLLQQDVDRARQVERDELAAAKDVEWERTGAAEVRARVEAEHGPVVAAATAERDTARTDLDRVSTAAAGQVAACNAEVSGSGGSGMVGEGPRAGAVCATATQLTEGETRARERLGQAEGELRTAVSAQQAAMATALERDRPRVPPVDPSDLGVVDRVVATHHVLGVWAWPFAAALVCLDVLPIIRHLSSGERPYEQALAPTPPAPTAAPENSSGDTEDPAPENSSGDGGGEDLATWFRAARAANPRASRAELWRLATAAGVYEASESSWHRKMRDLDTT